MPCGGMDAGWKPGGSKIGEKSSLLSDDAATSSSEDNSTPAGCREDMHAEGICDLTAVFNPSLYPLQALFKHLGEGDGRKPTL